MFGKKEAIQSKKKGLSKSYIWRKLMPLLVLPVARHRQKALRSWAGRSVGGAGNSRLTALPQEPGRVKAVQWRVAYGPPLWSRKGPGTGLGRERAERCRLCPQAPCFRLIAWRR